MKRAAGLQPRWPDRVFTLARSHRRGGRRSRTVRRSIAVLLLLAAGVTAALGKVDRSTGLAVVTVTRDLPTGATIGSDDLSIVRLPFLPNGAVRTTGQAAGRLLAAPVRRGEVLTDLRLVSTNRSDPGPGRVAVPVRPADPGTVALLGAGMHVAVLAVAQDGRPTLLAADCVVLAIPPPMSDPTRRLVVLSVPMAAADRVTAAGVVGTVALRFASG